MVVDTSYVLVAGPPLLEHLDEQVPHQRQPLDLRMETKVKSLHQELSRPHVLYRYIVLVVQASVRYVAQAVGDQLLWDFRTKG